MANIRKSNNISNDTGSSYSNVTNTQAKINNIQERFDDTTENDNPYDGAIQYINKKIEETIDIVNLIEVNTGDGASVATYAEKLKANPSIGGVQFSGLSDINLPGVNIAGNQDTSGNAASATKLATARTIGGTSFDGTRNIVPATATNALGYKNSNTNYKLMPADFYMMNSTSNYSGGYITIPAGGECHAQLTLPLESKVLKKNTIIYSSAVGGTVEIWMVPFDGVGSPSRRIGSGLLGKQILLNDQSGFNANKYYLWIKITTTDDDGAIRVYGGDVEFGQ